MQIKAADERERDVKELELLLRRADLTSATRSEINQEIRKIRAGSKAEREAAYQIEFYLSRNQRIMTIHDLRIECEGRVAQIDHLVVTSLLDIWLCESKHFSEGVAINEYGEWSAYYGRRLLGVASPIEQNKRHSMVLNDLLGSGAVQLPKKLGIARRPAIKTVVLVSKDARITRPKGRPAAHVEGLESVIKCDQFISVMDKTIDTRGAGDLLLGLAWLGTIERFARQLAALHKPISTDWLARFGLPRQEDPTVNIPTPHPRLQVISVVQPPADQSDPLGKRSTGLCELCGRLTSPAEITFCRENAARFGGKLLCYGCQRRMRRIS